jgi:hypothetical protein
MFFVALAQDYYGMIRNTNEQVFGRAIAQKIEKFGELAKNALFQVRGSSKNDVDSYWVKYLVTLLLYIHVNH